jgi:hypothetical protein
MLLEAPPLDKERERPRRPGRLSSIAGDFDGDHARDQLLAFVTSTGGASNDAYNLFGLAGCQLRQVRIAGSSALQILVGASLGHAEGFDRQRTDRRGRRLLTLWGIERAQDHPDGRSTYTWTATSYCWAAGTLVHPVGTTSGTFVAAPEDPPPAELTTRCGAGSW